MCRDLCGRIEEKEYMLRAESAILLYDAMHRDDGIQVESDIQGRSAFIVSRLS
jgi:hypothetical protein